jgi:hypothetical protein
MQLPASSSPVSVTDSEDASVARRLIVASNNAEVNRFAFFQYDDISETTPVHVKTHTRELHFDPIVKVRAIRPRSNTMKSNVSDLSVGSSCCPVSPRGSDYVIELNDTNPDSDDDEFNRFYNTMPSVDIISVLGKRRASVDDLSFIVADESGFFGLQGSSNEALTTPDSTTHVARPRSVSCDDYFFRQNIGP